MGRLNMRQSFVDVLRSSADERRALFSAAASDLETRAENIEKDLYVCWVLDFLFNRRKESGVGAANINDARSFILSISARCQVSG
jgi:hypothetical protein